MGDPGALQPFQHYFSTLSLSIDGWMTRNLMSFPSAFQSYQDDGQMIIKGCVDGNPFIVEKISRGGRAKTWDS